MQEILQKASGALKSSVQGLQKVGKSVVEVNADTQGVRSISSSSQGAGEAAIQDHFMVSKSGVIPPLIVVVFYGSLPKKRREQKK